jgi:crotonobetainyl-CoA:carnitine CoA-transferase CaiB-like acyl-CoA transferase
LGKGLFDGLRVVDCASFVAAPAAATLMSDFGADVIKIEPPEGDPYRRSYAVPGQPVPKHNHLWMLGSRNKRSIVLDLKTAEGLEVLYRLLDTADVFITNLPLSVRRRLKVGDEDVCPERPRLIYASLTAYGETGPEVDKAGFDSTAYWARSGLIDLMRANLESEPLRPVGGLGDQPSSVTLYAAIVSALYRRERTGRGGKVSASLLAGGLWANALVVQASLCGAPVPPRQPREKSANACVNTYRCGDGRWFNIMILNEERQFRSLLDVLGCAELASDPRFATPEVRRSNAQQLVAIFDGKFAERDQPEWRRRLDAAGITFDVVGTVDDIHDDPQMRAIGAVLPFIDDSGILTVNSPFDLEGVDKTPPGPAPALGQHSAEILREAGFTDAEIERLKETKAIGQQ